MVYMRCYSRVVLGSWPDRTNWTGAVEVVGRCIGERGGEHVGRGPLWLEAGRGPL